MSSPMFKVEVSRRVGNVRLTICVEEQIDVDLYGRPLPAVRFSPDQHSPLTWTDIGYRVNVVAHEFANELVGNGEVGSNA